MTSIAHRTAVLIFARFTNNALRFLSPVFLVRLFTVEQYGLYLDFLLYASMLAPWIQLSVNSSLPFFVPKDPRNERLYLTQATLFVLVSSTIIIALLYLAADYLPSQAAREFIGPLCLYLFFFNNLDAWETFWLAKRNSFNVLVYSVSRLGLRMIVVVGTAAIYRSLYPVLWALVVFECARFMCLAAYGISTKLFVARTHISTMKSQLSFILPLAISSILYYQNMYVGRFVISSWLGPESLALFTVGMYLQPIVQVFRNSIADVIMPEIVSQRDVESRIALRLWQRATLVYCAVMLPLSVLLIYYAGVVVVTLFTSKYIAAIPIFQIYTFVLIRECFDFSLPLRAVNQTRPFLLGSALTIVVNVAVMVALFDWIGILAPAVAMIVTMLFGAVYLAYYVIKHCGFSLGNLLPWTDIGKIGFVAVACLPVLIFGGIFPLNSLLRAVVFGAIYVCLYLVILQRIGVDDISHAITRLRARILSPRMRK